ncbi:hypothetical protein AAULH_14301, partial [Lactobacillus helveticus MTCC 5463]
FIMFGVPVFAMLFAATYMLSYFTALRYEKHDQRISEISQEEALSIDGKKRKVDLKEEFYVCLFPHCN